MAASFPRSIIIVTSFGHGHGWGHCVRCREFFETWRRFETVWLFDGASVCGRRGRRELKPRRLECDGLAEFVRQRRIEALLIDDPQLPTAALHVLRERCPQVRFVAYDDYYHREFEFDLHVSLGNRRGQEAPAKTHARGIEFIVVRAAAFRQRWRARPRRRRRRLLITFGGADPRGASFRAVDYFRDGGESPVTRLIVGRSFARRRELRSAARAAGLIVLNGGMGRPDVPQLLAASDAAVVNAGTTVNEALAVGAPVISIPQSPLERAWLDCVERQLELRLPRRLTPGNLERVLQPSPAFLVALERAAEWFRHDCVGARGVEGAIHRAF